MKKKLEAELISIAHRILKLKNKSELVQLHQETQKLYEKLSVLRFWEENFDETKPTIGHAELEEKLDSVFENQEAVQENSNVAIEENIDEDSSKETLDDAEEIKDEPIAEAKEAFSNEIIFEVAEPKAPVQKFTLEDLLSDVSSDPIFERVVKTDEKKAEVIMPLEEIVEEKETELAIEETTEEEETIEEEEEEETIDETLTEENVEENEIDIPAEVNVEEPIKPSAENSKNENKKAITLGLNDRVAFEKHLFGGSAADLNRVISQLITYDSFEEAQDFIEEMVKPDYHNWEGKEEYALRFMDIVEKKFR